MNRDEQIEEISCKKCLHYEMCLEKFRKAKDEGFWELTDEDEYFAHADECDFYVVGYRKQSEWISVDERLPDEAYFGNGLFRWSDNEEFVPVTHWMPLPQPPKMRKEDEGK